MNCPDMKCPDKEELQQKCTAAWNTYESMIKDLGLPFHPTTGIIMPQSAKDLRKEPIDPKIGLVRQPYLAAVRP
jgi:hypothetical protein